MPVSIASSWWMTSKGRLVWYPVPTSWGWWLWQLTNGVNRFRSDDHVAQDKQPGQSRQRLGAYRNGAENRRHGRGYGNDDETPSRCGASARPIDRADQVHLDHGGMSWPAVGSSLWRQARRRVCRRYFAWPKPG